MPKVSVLMPVYKTNEAYLRETIESILNQTYTDFEFLILDDCPSDSRESVVKSYKDKRIKYLKNEKNLGITPSRNKLIDISQGEYLAVVDHDDISLPERFEKEVAYLDKHPECGVVGTNMMTIPYKKITHHPQENEDIKIALMRHCIISHTTSMIRKSILTDNNIRYEAEFSPSEDFGLWCRLLKITDFHNLPDILVHYRKHATNTSKTQTDKMERTGARIRAIMKESYPEYYSEYERRATYTTQINLFGFIPFLKTVTQTNKTNIYLFNKLPLLKLKRSDRLGKK